MRPLDEVAARLEGVCPRPLTRRWCGRGEWARLLIAPRALERAMARACAVSGRFCFFRFYAAVLTPVLACPVFRPMQQQPGLLAVAGPFVKVRLSQPGEDGKFFVVAVLFCHHAPLTPCPRPSLSTTSCQRSKIGSLTLLVSRSGYT